ncbi:MAG: BolA family protein [Neisseria sp.]|nr:BolA family protein [Neisseria sp.]
MNILDEIKRLLAPLNASVIELQDESHRHRGHAGAQHGGHYRLTVVSEAFVGHNRLSRQRMINHALKNLFHTHIHALSICAQTPAENSVTPS